jgi:hypothetical protein
MFGFTRLHPLIKHERFNYVRYVHGSLAHVLNSVLGSFDISVGSSFATHELVRLSQETVKVGLNKKIRPKGCFKWTQAHLDQRLSQHKVDIEEFIQTG